MKESTHVSSVQIVKSLEDTDPERRSQESSWEDFSPSTHSVARKCDDNVDYTQLDPGIVHAVRVLRTGGVKTLWSCEGGAGHAYREPTVVLDGDLSEAMRALRIAYEGRLGPYALERVWFLKDGVPDPVGQLDEFGRWHIVFSHKFGQDPAPAAQKIQQGKLTQDSMTRRPAQNGSWNQLRKLEPELESLLNRVRSGDIDLTTLWLTFLSEVLAPLVGPNRLNEGPASLFTKEAFDAALWGLYESIPVEPHDAYGRE
jgi:hypothetical protein